MDKLIWYPPTGDSITFGPGPFIWRSEQDFSRTKTSPLTTKGPFQVGTTLLDSNIDARTMSITLAITGNTREEYQENRNILINSMTMEIAGTEGSPTIGVLRYERDGFIPLELECVPIDSPVIDEMGSTIAYADIEFYAPYPFWREIEDHFQEFKFIGGVEYPLEYPLAYPISSIETEVTNFGNISTPPIFRIYGRIVNPVIHNITTGEMLGLIGEIAEGDHVLINTKFGNKTITLVHSDNSTEDAFHLLNLDQSDFWHIQRGINVIRLEYLENFTGFAHMWWRNRFAGV